MMYSLFYSNMPIVGILCRPIARTGNTFRRSEKCAHIQSYYFINNALFSFFSSTADNIL